MGQRISSLQGILTHKDAPTSSIKFPLNNFSYPLMKKLILVRAKRAGVIQTTKQHHNQHKFHIKQTITKTANLDINLN